MNKDKFVKFYRRTLDSYQEMSVNRKRNILGAAALLLLALLAILIWKHNTRLQNENIVKGNGRIEATEIDIAPRFSGRVGKITVREGDLVRAGDVLVYMDTDVLDAQLKEVNAKMLQASNFVTVKESLLAQRKSEKNVAESVLKQRSVELEVAEKKWNRAQRLVNAGAISEQSADDDWAAFQSAKAARDAAVAQVQSAESSILIAQAEVQGAESNVAATKGIVARIQADIHDSTLRAPLDGRVQYRISQPGEVVAAGSPVISLADLSDVYMTFFLPTADAGRVTIGEEVRIVLDAAPHQVIPAYISFVADVAQFTPKTVETSAEREKFMFRVKAQIPPDLLKKSLNYVKTGLPGVVYIRLDHSEPWPKHLQATP